MRGIHVIQAAIVVALLVLGAFNLPTLLSRHSWQPDPGDWTHFRHDAQHTGNTLAPGAFSPNGDLHVKWVHTNPNVAYVFPPVVGNLDNTGGAEVVQAGIKATVTTAGVQFQRSIEVLDGRSNTTEWSIGPTTGYLILEPPTLGDIDGDGQGDVIWFDGNPVAGTGASRYNQVHARDAHGNVKWDWSDPDWQSLSNSNKVPLVTSLSATSKFS